MLQCIAQQEVDTINEIPEFENNQYVSAAEATWCLSQNEVVDRKPFCEKATVASSMRADSVL